MRIVKVTRWVSAQKEVRVYATIERADGTMTEGTRYVSGNHFQAKNSIDAGLTESEWTELALKAYYADDGKPFKYWHSIKPVYATAPRSKSSRSYCVDCGADDTDAHCGCDY